MAHPNIRTIAGTFGWNERDQGYENEYYGRRFTPELARAIRTHKISPSDYDDLALNYDYTSPREQKILVQVLHAEATAIAREKAREANRETMTGRYVDTHLIRRTIRSMKLVPR